MKRCGCCSKEYDDVVFYCESCLKCCMCGKEMTADMMYKHCEESHIEYVKGDTYARCTACSGVGKLSHLAEHIMSSHASSRVKI